MLYTKENDVQVYHEDKTKLNQKLTDDDALAKMNMSAIFCKTIIIAVKKSWIFTSEHYSFGIKIGIISD